MGKVFAGFAVLIAALSLMGCAAESDDAPYEQIFLEDSSFVLGAGDTDNGVDPVSRGACGCGDNYQCLSDWAEANFNCGICVSVACGEDRADVCTALCGPEPLTADSMEPIAIDR